jgi:hypothetical protein
MLMLPAADLFYGIDGGLFHDDNVSRAQPGPDAVGDSGVNANAALGMAYALGERGTLALSANLRLAQYQRFHGLDMAALGGTLSYRGKFGLGAYALRLSLNGSLAAESYADSVRNGLRSRVWAELAQRLSPRWDVSTGIAADRFHDDNVQPLLPQLSGDAFGISGRSLYARADYALSERWQVTLGASARRGEVVSSSRPNDEVFEYSSAVAVDPAFGPGYFAYKLAGRTGGAKLGASVALSAHASLNFGLARDVTRSEGGLEYRNNIGNATFVYSY